MILYKEKIKSNYAMIANITLQYTDSISFESAWYIQQLYVFAVSQYKVTKVLFTVLIGNKKENFIYLMD